MLKLIVKSSFIILILLVLVACRTEREVSESEDLQLSCVQLEPIEIEMLTPVNTFEVYHAVYKGDTLYPDNLSITANSDTIALQTYLKDIEIPELILEAHIQGKTFYKMMFGEDKILRSTKVVRGIGSSMSTVENTIISKMNGTEIIAYETPTDSVEVIFFHKLRLK